MFCIFCRWQVIAITRCTDPDINTTTRNNNNNKNNNKIIIIIIILIARKSKTRKEL